MRLVVYRTPPTYRFYCNFLFRHTFFPVGNIARRGNSNTLQSLWIEIGMSCILAWEVAPQSGNNLKVLVGKKIVSFSHFCVILSQKLFFASWGDIIRVIEFLIGHVPHIILILLRIKEIGKKNPFFNSRIPNVFGKFDSAMGKQIHRIDEFDIGYV